jgi:hypothetical protein
VMGRFHHNLNSRNSSSSRSSNYYYYHHRPYPRSSIVVPMLLLRWGYYMHKCNSATRQHKRWSNIATNHETNCYELPTYVPVVVMMLEYR